MKVSITALLNILWTSRFLSVITSSQTEQLQPWFSSMRSCVCYPVHLVTKNLRSTTVSTTDYWKLHSTRVRQNFAAGRSPKFCFPGITPISQSDAKNKRSGVPAKIGRIFSDNIRNDDGRAYWGAFPSTTHALIPPKPKELLITYFSSAWRP